MRKYILLLALIVSLLLTSSCGINRSQEFSSKQFVMDTLVEIKVFTADEEKAKEALSAGFKEFERVSELADRNIEEGVSAYSDTDVSKINDNAGIKPIKVHKDTLEMLYMAKEYSRKTDGAFDITIGPLVDLWGFSGENNVVPKEAEIDKYLPYVDSEKLEIEKETGKVYLPEKEMSLDLGAVAKGYAVDKAADAISQQLGIDRAMINAGGNIYAVGKKDRDQKWKVGIQDPRDETEFIGTLSLEDEAAVTSGDYQRYFEKNEVRYHHLLDPRTGKPARKTMSVTVVCDNSTTADILSTAVFIMGPTRGMEFVENTQNAEAVFISADKEIMVSSGMEEKLDLNLEAGYSYDQT